MKKGLIKKLRDAALAGIVFALAALGTAVIAVTVGSEFSTDGIAANQAVSASRIKNNFDALKTAVESIADCTNIPRVRLVNSGAQSVPRNAATPLTFDTEDFDTDNMHDTTTNTSRITFNTAGTYHVLGQIYYNDDGSDNLSAIIVLNGVLLGNTIALNGRTSGAAGTDHIQQVAVVREFAAGDFVELYARPSNSTNPTVDVCGVAACPGNTTQVPSFFTAFRICGS